MHCCQVFMGRSDSKFCRRACYNAWLPGNINRKPKSAEHRRRIGETQRGKSKGPQSAEHRKRIADSKRGKAFSDEHRRALSLAKVRQMEQGGFTGRQTTYISVKSGLVEHAHSSYELRRMKFLDICPDVVTWTKRHGFRLPYEFAGQVKLYIPDFLVTWVNGIQTLEEVKGWVRDPERVAAKSRAAEVFAAANNLRYATLRNGDLESTWQD